MDISTPKVKFFMTLFFVSMMPMTYGLPLETEYLGVVARSGYFDDGAWGAFPIGFSFDFFGNAYTDFYVTSNGLVMFGTGSTQYRNRIIPTATAPNNYIAPFWDDIVIHNTGDILYQTIGTSPNRKLVVQFNNMSFWNSPVLLGTFQVILFEGSNKIQTQYRSIVDLTSDRASGNSATIGLENSNGSSGVLCSFETAGYITSEKAILFTPGGGTYTYNDNAIYEGVLLQNLIPRASTPNLVSPAYNSTVGDTVTFQWEVAANASSYYVVVSLNSDLSSPIHTSADLTDLSYDYILATDQTYYWSSYSKNSVGAVSWSEIWKFQTSPIPPLVSVPQTIYMEQGEQRTATLRFTGGDAGTKTATITSLPLEGTLNQYNGGVPGALIATVPTVITDPSFRLIYTASGATGNGAGNFQFNFSDATWTSTDGTFTINVSPPGIPNFLYASKEIDRVEITFDRAMADPIGKHLEFSVKDNGINVTSTSCILKPGDPATIIVYVSPNLNTANAISVAYLKGSVTAESSGVLESFDFQLAGKLAQVINFSVLPDKIYGDGDYSLSATATSGLPITFNSSNSTVVSVSGSTASVNNAGETLIFAAQPGNAVYAPVSYERHQLVNKAIATITLSNLAQEYTGSGIQATASTFPVGLNLKVTYDGLAALPVDLGSYEVSAEIEEANYSGDATGTLIVSDSTPPVPDLVTLPDVTGECAVTPVAPNATDLYSGTITGTATTTFPINSQGITTITWTYNDGNGNVSTQNQNVVIADITDPEMPVLLDLTGECSATAIPPTTLDACSGTITGTTSDPLTYTAQGTHIITWNFDDGNGNSINVTQNVVITDLTAPEFPVLLDVTGECSATATPPTTLDACAGTITGTTSDPLTYTAQGTHIITWNFDDGNGNSINVTQNVVITDLTAPEFPVLLDVTGECSATAVAPTTLDACAGTITGTTSDPLTYTAQGTHVITWNFDDGNGNSINVTQNVVVIDLTDPEMPTLTDLTGECSVPALAPTTLDACAGILTGTTSDPLTYTTQGTHVITWNFDDGNGNNINVTQNVVVTDLTDPEIPTLTDLTGECSVTALAPTTLDACAGILTGTTSDPLTYTAQGTHVITWNFDDGNGNSINVTQNVVVTDLTDPEIPALTELTGECSVTALAPTTLDACAGILTGTTSDPLTYTTQGTHVITWNFDDGNGNRMDVTQNVVIEDITAPSATCPDDVITCSGSAGSIGLTDVHDNCTLTSIAYELTGATSASGFGDASTEEFNPGETTVTYTLEDDYGNRSQCLVTVMYQVTEEIVVSSAEGILRVETMGSYQWINCNDHSIINGQTESSFAPELSGEYAVIVTQGACTDTSGCYMVDLTGSDKYGMNQGFKVYPSPAEEFITIQMGIENTNVNIKMVNMMGQTFWIKEMDELEKTNIDVSHVKPGVYLIVIESEQLSGFVRFIKE